VPRALGPQPPMGNASELVIDQRIEAVQDLTIAVAEPDQ
jgi:hypothetical protein